MRTLEDCYRYADEHEGEAGSLLNFAAGTAADYRRKLTKLAWACKEPNKKKRANAVHILVMELQAAGESTADLPMHLYA